MKMIEKCLKLKALLIVALKNISLIKNNNNFDEDLNIKLPKSNFYNFSDKQAGNVAKSTSNLK